MEESKVYDPDIIKKVEFELKNIRLREIEIQDIELQIEELKLGDTLKAQQYNDMPTGTRQCSNNDSNLLKIMSLERRIQRYRIARRKIDNALSVLDLEEEEVIRLVMIDKISITKASDITGKQRKTINKIKDVALNKLAYFYDIPSDYTEMTQT